MRALERDMYVSVRTQRTNSLGELSGPDSFVFVDTFESNPRHLRRVPASALRNQQSTLILRAHRPLAIADLADDELGDEAREVAAVLKQWGLPNPVGILHQPLGEAAWIEGVQGDAAVVIERARAVELESLLEWGRAIWRPSDFHYRLPSGEHAEAFIKLADAIRDPRDAEVVASWLSPYLREEVGFLLDTGTITSIYEAATRRMHADGLRSGPVAVLEHYPRTAVDVEDAVEYAAGGHGRVLALLSVNSSGSVRDRITAALRRTSGLVDPQLVVMIDKDRPTERPFIDTWSPLPGDDPLVKRGVRASADCPLCASPRASRLVAINPLTFDGMGRGQLRPIMPSINDAHANWRLWEACANDDGAVAIESRSLLADSVARPNSLPMAVRIDVAKLIGSEDFRATAAKEVALLKNVLSPEDDPLGPVRFRSRALDPDCDLVIVAPHERKHADFDELWVAVAPSIAPKAEVLMLDEGQLMEATRERIASAERILIFALGSVSGHFLQRALFAVQQAHRSRDYDLQGLVLHSRLETSRDWETLCNSFDRRLHAPWIFFVPERSPLREEQKALQRLSAADYDGVVGEFLDERMRLCAGEIVGEKPPLFWGSHAADRLTRNSIFGQRLDARTTFAAVGAAMARARVDHDRRQNPEVRVFDLAGMLRSYYDPLIVSSFFRWLGPYEAWWGWQGWEAERTINTLFSRIGEEDGALDILVPELLLATALGKVHEAAITVVRRYAERLGEETDDERLAAIVTLGLDLSRTVGAEPLVAA